MKLSIDKTVKNIETVKNALETICAANGRSAWDRGVSEYAGELLDKLDEGIRGGYISADVLDNNADLKNALLSGAENWGEYSWGGYALIYDGDIAARLCSPSELKKTRYGMRRPNNREEWLDAQTRALAQACTRVVRAAMKAREA